MKRLKAFNRFYIPVCPPCADTDFIARQGDRLMLRHGSPTAPQLTVFVAPEGEVNAGWVIGIFDPKETPTPATTVKATPGARHPFESGAVAENVRQIAEQNRRAALSKPDSAVIPVAHTIRTHALGFSSIPRENVCDVCGGFHSPTVKHAWENDHTDDALTYGDIRTEK